MKDNKDLKDYLRKEWRFSNIPKYHIYFQEWFNNLTEQQITHYTAYMKGFKTL